MLFLGMPQLAADVTSQKILPTATDSQIGETYNLPHTLYVNRDIIVEHSTNLPPDRHELLLFLPGTNGSGAAGGAGFCALAANLGYHAISLTYATGISAAEACATDRDPKCFENFRLALIEGGASKHLTVSRADSIENRLIKLLGYLNQRRPKENWSQFLVDDQTLKWDAIAVSGQSQGGGHAALIAIRHRVARAVCLGAPKDFNKMRDAPAAWYEEPAATPKALFFTFNHVEDRQGCTPAELLQNLRALKLTDFGPAVDAATSHFPFKHTRILSTTYPATNKSKVAHGSVVATANAARWESVWTYMLTEKAP